MSRAPPWDEGYAASCIRISEKTYLLGSPVNKGTREGREDARNARPCRAFVTPLYYYGFSGSLLSVSGYMDRREEGTKRWISQLQRRR